MEIKLSPDIAALVETDVAAGKFASPEEYVAAAVELLHERKMFLDDSVDELNDSLERAIAEANSEGWLGESEARQRMSKMKADWAGRRSA